MISKNKALSQVKCLNARIRHYMSVSDGSEKSIDHIINLIEQRNNLKMRVLRSNAESKIEINGHEMTMLEAIELRQHYVEDYKKVLDILLTSYVCGEEPQIDRAKKLSDEIDQLTTELDDKIANHNSTTMIEDGD